MDSDDDDDDFDDDDDDDNCHHERRLGPNLRHGLMADDVTTVDVVRDNNFICIWMSDTKLIFWMDNCLIVEGGWRIKMSS